jgi:hypothetical protein
VRTKEKSREYDRARKLRNPNRCKEWRKNNPEKAKIAVKNWQLKNKKRIAAYVRNRYKTDFDYRIKMQLRGRLNAAIKKNVKTGSAVTLLGCTIQVFKEYIESKFEKGMSWENWGHDTWNIDHVRPLASFDLADKNQLAIACHYTNMQPLWSFDNYSKGAKIL